MDKMLQRQRGEVKRFGAVAAVYGEQFPAFGETVNSSLSRISISEFLNSLDVSG